MRGSSLAPLALVLAGCLGPRQLELPPGRYRVDVVVLERPEASRTEATPAVARAAGAVAGAATTAATGNPAIGAAVGWATTALLAGLAALGGRRRR